MKNSCHKDYTNQRRLDNFLKKKVANDKRLPGSLLNSLTGKNNVSTVGLTLLRIKKHPDQNIVHLATTLLFRNNTLKFCEQKLSKGNFFLFIAISIL